MGVRGLKAEAIPIGAIGPDPGGHLEQHPFGERHDQRCIVAPWSQGHRLIMIAALDPMAIQPWVDFQLKSA